MTDGSAPGPPDPRSARPEPPPSAPAPPLEALAALPSDASAWLLPHVRAALHGLEAADVTPVVRRLRAAPTSRLAGGRVRRELDQLLAAGGPVWRAVVERVRAQDHPPAAVACLVEPGAARDRHDSVAPAPAAAVRQEAAGAPRGHASARDERRMRERLREARDERDELRRQLQGANARASAADETAARTAEELDVARRRIVQLEAQVAAAAADRERAVDRERRRQEAEIARLERAVSDLRRAEEDRRREARRREERARIAEQEATRRVAERRRGPEVAAPARLVPGRPSRLPAEVHPGTTEAAALLLHPGRLVYVDGYNVTKQHQPDLDLEGQRAWLVRTLAALAARRRVRPEVVFDGQGAAGSRPAVGRREVAVRFTPAGVTADDELVLAVEATDEPVTVVTDDRELTERLTASGADVIGTRGFLGVTR